MTVLAPSAWDPSIRLEPPKAVPSVKKRQVVVCLNKVLYYTIIYTEKTPELKSEVLISVLF